MNRDDQVLAALELDLACDADFRLSIMRAQWECGGVVPAQKRRSADS